MSSLHAMLIENGNDLTNHDVAVLSDWAAEMHRDTPNTDWKRAYALIREGADLLLRRRARSTADEVPHDRQPEQLNHQRRDPSYCLCGHLNTRHGFGGNCLDCPEGSIPCGRDIAQSAVV
jgi:hypothetical protein